MKLLKGLCAMLALMAVASCGGGGSDAGTPPFGGGDGSTTAMAVTAALVDADGNPAESLSLGSVRRVKVTVLKGKAPVPQALVQVSGDDKVNFSPADGSGSTDASGVAYVQVLPASLSTTGASNLSIAASKGGESATTSVVVSIAPSNVTLSDFTVGTSPLPAFGSTEVAVRVNGVTAGVPVQVQFTSGCVTAGKAEISPSPATAGNDGVVRVTYKDAGGCGVGGTSSDAITASIVGTTTSISGSIGLSQPAATNIEFVSATPTEIYLQGSGYVTSSKVRFRVVDQLGGGRQGIQVALTPDTSVGGLKLDNTSTFPITKTTDSEGYVDVDVLAGTVPTPVRVSATAFLPSGQITSVSSALSIRTGLPSQRNFSFSATRYNLEGMNTDGDGSLLTVRVADRSGNPVPDGTAINFRTEGGQVVGSCATQRVQGISMCQSVRFESQNPRPANGYVSMMVYALGEESFIDSNGNNIFDASEAYDDLGDVFLDINENGVWDAGEDFVPFAGAGNTAACAAANTSLSKPGTCDGKWGRAHVRANPRFVFSDTSRAPRWTDVASEMPAPDNDGPPLAPIVIGCDQVRSATYLLRDANTLRNNPWPEGSVVSAEGTNVTVKIINPRIGSTLEPTTHTVEVSNRSCEEGVVKGDAAARIIVTSPLGKVWIRALTIQNP